MYEPTMGLWENIRAFKDRYILVLFIAGALGLGPGTYKRMKTYYRFQKELPKLVVAHDSINRVLQNEISDSRKFSEVSHAALRSLMDLKAIGIVRLNNKMVDVEVRRCGMKVDGKEEEAEWVFILGDHLEMYEAVYSPIWRGYHYVDATGKYQQIKYLSYDEDYIKDFN